MTDNIIWAFWGHEPLAHYYRLGSKQGSIFRLGEWSAAWYERLHSEEALQKAASLGVNMIYTHYFKGFGLKAEHGEMERTRELAAIARRLGMRVLGYCQLGTLYYETMLDEADDLEEWVMRDAGGSIACWGGAYYRWSPCFTSTAYKAYMKRVIRYGLEHVGLDGFHFDNSYNKPCYCPRCQQAFRDYLTERVRDPERELGLPHVRHVRIPAFSDGEGVYDPLYAIWLDFRRQLTASVHAELFEHVKLLSDERALVMHNPAFPRQCGHVNRIGYEPADSPAAVDIVVAENDKFIGRSGPELRTQIEAYKYGERFGYRVFNSSWLKDEQRQIRIPETEAEIALYEAESMVYGGLCGTPWLMRSLKREDESVLDQAVQTQALSPIFAYFKRHSELYKSVRPVNSVKVLYHPDNLMLAIRPGYLSLLAVVQCLVENAVPFSYVTPDEAEALREGEVLIVPHLTFAADAEVESIRTLADKGHPLAVIGPFGTYDARGVERAERELLPDGDHILRLESLAVVKEGDSGKHMTAVSAQLGNNAERLVSFVRDRSRGLRVTLSEPALLCETTEDAEGRLLVHVIRPDNAGAPLDRVTVRLTYGPGASYAHAELFSFEQPRLAGFDSRDGTAELVIEGLATLATVRLSGQDEADS